MFSERNYQNTNQTWNFIPKSWCATNVIIAICVAFIFLQFIVNAWFKPGLLAAYLDLNARAFVAHEYWRFVTYALLHDGIAHIFLNMLVFFFAGYASEQLLGKKKFVLLYVLSIFFGGVFWLLINQIKGENAMLVGASAGVLGVLSFLLASYPNRPLTFLLFFIFPIRATPKQMFAVVFFTEALGFLFIELAPNAHESIAFSSHLGGILTGLVFAKLVNGKLFGLPYWREKNFFEKFVEKVKARKGAMRAADSSFNVSISKPSDLRKEVDRILDKINEKGFASLTDSERETLKQAKDKL